MTGSMLPGDTGAEPSALSAVAADCRRIGRGNGWRGSAIVETTGVQLLLNERFRSCGVKWLFGTICSCAVDAADDDAAVALQLALGRFNGCGGGCFLAVFFRTSCGAARTGGDARVGAAVGAFVFGGGCGDGCGPRASSARSDGIASI